MRILISVLFVLLTVMLAACPQKKAEPPEQSVSTPAGEPQSRRPEYMPKEDEVLAVLNAMADAMNNHDRVAFEECFHPDSPELEEMLRYFDEFKPVEQRFEFFRLSVEDLSATEALVEYSAEISNPENHEQFETESGEFEMVRTVEGRWLIMDLD